MRKAFSSQMLIALLFVVVQVANAQTAKSKSAKPLKITLHIKNFASGNIRLAGIYGDQKFLLDSTAIDANGNGVLKMDTAIASGMYFLLFPDNYLVQLLIDNDQQFTLDFDKQNIYNSMKVSNSLDNQLLYQNLVFEVANGASMDSLNKILKKLKPEDEDYKKNTEAIEKLKEARKQHVRDFEKNYSTAFFTKFKIAGQNPEVEKVMIPGGGYDEARYVYDYRNEFWNGYDFTDERMLHTPVYFNKLKRYLQELTPQVPDSIIVYADKITTLSKANPELFKFTANWIAVYYKEAKLMGHESVYVFMVDKYWTIDQAFWSKNYEVTRIRVQANQMKPSLLGMTAQNISGKDENGKAVSLYDINAPFTVIYFFSYDCDNCKKETPKLMNVYHEWKDKGLELFTVCIDGEEEGWKEYLHKNDMPSSGIFDPDNNSGFRSHYYFEVTPGIFVIDNNRKIIGTQLGAESIPVLLQRYIQD